ncbi:MAG: hypothetical protein AAF226_18135, partial [Verrucomicrobiota bacterium]
LLSLVFVANRFADWSNAVVFVGVISTGYTLSQLFREFDLRGGRLVTVILSHSVVTAFFGSLTIPGIFLHLLGVGLSFIGMNPFKRIQNLLEKS